MGRYRYIDEIEREREGEGERRGTEIE